MDFNAELLLKAAPLFIAVELLDEIIAVASAKDQSRVTGVPEIAI